MNDQDWAARLVELGLAVRHALSAARDAGADMASPVAHEGGDTIFAIDRHVEPVLKRVVSGWVGAGEAILLVAEGLGPTGELWIGDPRAQTRRRLLVDPIDGTRGIMYDKRSAWFLGSVAPDSGDATRLSDASAAAMVELPTSKQGRADCFWATAGGDAAGRRDKLDGAESVPVKIAPSAAGSLENGFAQVANFFPGTKVLASELMERIAAAAGNSDSARSETSGGGMVFDDQYMSTGGQMVELLLGHDRFCCDLRPLFHRIGARQTGRRAAGLECHPYDMAGALVAQRAGVILTDGFGGRLDLPLDVETGVHWCGYANAKLRDRVAPVILEWLKEKGVGDETGS